MLNTKNLLKPAPLNLGVRPPSLAIDHVWRSDPNCTMDYPASPNASLRNFYAVHSRPSSPDDMMLMSPGPRPIFTRSGSPHPDAVNLLQFKARSASIRTTRTTRTFLANRRPKVFDAPDCPTPPAEADNMPTPASKSRFKKVMRTAGVVLRLRKKDRGIMNIAHTQSFAPTVQSKAPEVAAASSKGSIFRSVRPRKFSKVMAQPVDNTSLPRAFEQHRRSALKRCQSFTVFVDATATLDDADYDGFDETTRETMGVVLDIRRDIDYQEINGSEYSHLGYALVRVPNFYSPGPLDSFFS